MERITRTTKLLVCACCGQEFFARRSDAKICGEVACRREWRKAREKSARECGCGCGAKFTPRRTGQVYAPWCHAAPGGNKRRRSGRVTVRITCVGCGQRSSVRQGASYCSDLCARRAAARRRMEHKRSLVVVLRLVERLHQPLTERSPDRQPATTRALILSAQQPTVSAQDSSDEHVTAQQPERVSAESCAQCAQPHPCMSAQVARSALNDERRSTLISAVSTLIDLHQHVVSAQQSERVSAQVSAHEHTGEQWSCLLDERCLSWLALSDPHLVSAQSALSERLSERS